MKFLRNKTIKTEMLIYGLIAAVIAVICFFISATAGVISLVISFCYFAAHFISSYVRYKQISDLSLAVDRILHGTQDVLINDGKEGELYVLKSEIGKMTVRLKENSDRLSSDKIMLTNAIADISHQLRTPLTAVNLTVALLKREDISNDKRAELFMELNRSLKKIDYLVEILLKLSKIDAGTVHFNKEEVFVGEIIKQSLETLKIPIELKGAEVNINIGKEKFSGDAVWNVEAFENILKNCIEHIKNGGNITVTATENAIYTEIVIEDDGEGFDKEDIPHIFERFYKGKNSGQSSIGIGLALARGIIVAQNGTISAGNALSGGAKFTVRFYKTVV